MQPMEKLFTCKFSWAQTSRKAIINMASVGGEGQAGRRGGKLTLIAMRLACDFCARFSCFAFYLHDARAFEFDLINFMLIEKRC